MSTYYKEIAYLNISSKRNDIHFNRFISVRIIITVWKIECRKASNRNAKIVQLLVDIRALTQVVKLFVYALKTVSNNIQHDF